MSGSIRAWGEELGAWGMGRGAGEGKTVRERNGEEEMIETVKERNGEGENGRMGEKEKGEGKVEIGKS